MVSTMPACHIIGIAYLWCCMYKVCSIIISHPFPHQLTDSLTHLRYTNLQTSVFSSVKFKEVTLSYLNNSCSSEAPQTGLAGPLGMALKVTTNVVHVITMECRNYWRWNWNCNLLVSGWSTCWQKFWFLGRNKQNAHNVVLVRIDIGCMENFDET